MSRKKRKQEKKTKQLSKKQLSRLDELAKLMSISMTRRTPTNFEKRGQTFWDVDAQKKGCFPYGGLDGDLTFCENCFYQKCLKTRIDWLYKGGKFEKTAEYQNIV
jgi:hypothetical protein